MPVRHVVLIPAAGVGSRMGSATPKQYLPLSGKPVLRHTIDCFLDHSWIDAILVVISPDDVFYAQFDWPADPRLQVARVGAASRAGSVRNGLALLAQDLAEDDWILVHDAARPCLLAPELLRLRDELRDDPLGGILAMPVADTLKLADRSQFIDRTVPRESMWQAQTPQMFRCRLLLAALEQADLSAITDEASALELVGMHPRLVSGSVRNIKLTYPDDLALAEWILQQKEKT